MAYASVPFVIVQVVRLLENPGSWIRLLGVDQLRASLDSVCLSSFAQAWVAERVRLALVAEHHPKVRGSLKQLLVQLDSQSEHHLHDQERMVVFTPSILITGGNHAAHKLR